MKEFALVKDAFNGELFAVVTRVDGFTTYHGAHESGRQWAEDFNAGETKSAKTGFQDSVILGDFAPVTPSMQALIDEALEGKEVTFPDRTKMVMIGSADFKHPRPIPQIKNLPLRDISAKNWKAAVSYKAVAFETDTGRSSILFKAHMGLMGADKDGMRFVSRSHDPDVLSEEMARTAKGYGNVRRAVKDVVLKKTILLDQHEGYSPKPTPEPLAIQVKGNRLGRRLAPGIGGPGGGMRRLGRSARQPFDPNAWDGDGDGLVQEGTAWERPSIPGVNTNLPGKTRTNSKPKDFPSDTPDRVENRIATRRNEDRVRNEILNTPVREILQSTEIVGKPSPLKKFTSGFESNDRIWDAPLEEIPGMGGAFTENDLDNLLTDLVPRRSAEGLRSVRPRSNPAYSERLQERLDEDLDSILDNDPSVHHRTGMYRSDGLRRQDANFRNRARQAAAERVAAPRGLASRRGPAAPQGKTIVDPERDGKLWAQLTDPEREAVVEGLEARFAQLWNMVTGNRGTADRNTGEAWGAQWFDGTIRADNPDADQDFFSKYMPTRQELTNLQSVFDEHYPTPDQGDKDYIKNQKRLDDLKVLATMFENDFDSKARKRSEKNGGPFALLEHLHGTTRSAVWKAAQGKNPDLRTRKKLGDTGGSSIFGDAGGLTAEIRAAALKQAGRKRKRDSGDRSLAARIMRPDPARMQRRALRRQRRRGGVSGSYRTSETAKTRLERSAAKAKRLIRRRLRGKQGEKKVIALTDKNFEYKAVSVDSDGVLSISDEGISNLSKAYRRLLGDPDSLKPSMKGRSGKGIVGEDGTLSGQNPEMAVLWEANGMNSLPVLVDDADLDALVDAGWETISRGHGGADNAEDYLTDPLRFLPGAGGEASGKGEYWARARDGRDWSSWMSATSTTATVGVLPPKARRMDVDRRSKESDGNKTISDIFDLVRTGYSGDEITKVEPSELAKQIRAEFEAKGLTAESPHERWETEVGQLWQRLLESAERGNSKSVNVMLLLNKIAKTHRGENLIAPVLGYDTISTTDGRGVELVMNRGAVIALDETLMQKGALEWLDKAREISLQDRRS